MDTLARSADQLSGSERAEVLLRAADLIRDEDGDRAVELARQATEADADVLSQPKWQIRVLRRAGLTG